MTTTTPASGTSAATAETPNFGPSGIQSPNEKTFVLSGTGWYSLQRYISNVLILPTDESALRSYLGMRNAESIEPFAPMLKAYAEMRGHALWWKETVFPTSVNLADDIVHYNTQVEVYYSELRDRLDVLRRNPKNQEIKVECLEIIRELQDEATTFSSNAANVYQMIKEFSEQTAQDRDTLKQVDTDMEGLIGDLGKQTEELRQQIKETQTELERLNGQYEHEVVVAATTPTYAWVFPFGLIAAVVVAGVYGDRATKTKQLIEDAKQKIAAASGALERSIRLDALLRLGNNSVDRIQELIGPALKVIQKIEGGWRAIAADFEKLGEIIESIEERTEQLDKLLAAKLQVNTAIATWAKIAEKADLYRVNAFIEAPETPTLQALAA
jgi:DNA repair exonuclease SbcCD ATPase subunit